MACGYWYGVALVVVLSLRISDGEEASVSIVEECPSCGNYTSTPDGRLDVFVVYELCERCRKRPSDRDLQRIDYEEVR